MRTLIITLGSGQRRPDGNLIGYRRARYRFPDNFVSKPTQFFGLALFEWLRLSDKKAPDRLVVLGTAGSIWGGFFEYMLNEGIAVPGEDLEEAALSLDEQTQANEIGSEEVLRVERALTTSLGLDEGRVVCRLIPTALVDQQQREILTTIADAIPEDGTVDFDVTHGLRHLPVLELASALHLAQSRRKSRIGDLYYGALEMAEKGPEPRTAPVVMLNQVTQLLEWRDGVRDFERNGDIEVLCGLLGPEGDSDVRLREALKATQFYLETNQAHRAGDAAAQAEKILRKNEAPVAPEGQLFRDVLYRSVSWARDWSNRIGRHNPDRNSEFAKAQLEMADIAFKQRRYQRCIVLLIEALETSRLLPQERWDIFQHRENARTRINDELQGQRENLRMLNHLRNQVAHTVMSDNRVIAEGIASEDALRQFLMNRETGLFPWVREVVLRDWLASPVEEER